MSVYGKKIVIDGVEYVAVPQTKGVFCAGCEFFGNETFYPCESNEFRKIFGDVCTTHLNMILKKVTPKKNLKSTRNGLPSLHRREINAKNLENQNMIYGQPYLNPLDMMLSNKTVLVDNKPCKIIDSRHECDYVSTKHIVTFEEMPCNLMPVIRCDAASYIVCLSEPDGLKPSETPKQHYSEADAIKEAERLCKKHNQKFVVLKVVTEVEPEIKPKIIKRG